jgi:hypothetical protein
MVLAQFFALNESNGTISESLFGQPIFNYAKKKAIGWRRQHTQYAIGPRNLRQRLAGVPTGDSLFTAVK